MPVKRSPFSSSRNLSTEVNLSANLPKRYTVPLKKPHESVVFHVEISHLSFVPGARIVRYLGTVQLHFIRENLAVRSNDLLGQFLQLFLCETMSLLKSHVCALGGNALLCLTVTPHSSGGANRPGGTAAAGRGAIRSQEYNMLTVSGDAVWIEYLPEFVESSMHDGRARKKYHFEVEEDRSRLGSFSLPPAMMTK